MFQGILMSHSLIKINKLQTNNLTVVYDQHSVNIYTKPRYM